ncbi:MarR family winged helix-turn-helix transcriptional regulator [Microbacterium sp. 3J1]|uniref:MarR family winged helix-turn-helix transcriptional regulator n=1 Tax=Microbacterium sp. 3J1 TaxID=861269 RepID=UPI000B20C8DB|nr:MarR family winged helix-turn-helix transcriptional regulator [Microbacterium sp. 3J1]
MNSSAEQRIDEALIQMRKLWAPVTSGRPAAGAPPVVDLSTVLVVDAVSRLGVGPSIRQVAEHLSVAQTTASRIVDKAVAGGFVSKQPADDDVRRSELALSPRGRELLERSVEFRYSYLRTIVEGWSSEEVAEFSRLLSRFARTVADTPPDPTAPPGGALARSGRSSS